MCCKGPFPTPTVEEDEDDDDEEEEYNKVPSEMEEGDRVFTMVVHTEARHICAMENISQRLAAAHHHNTLAKSFKEAVLRPFSTILTVIL